MGPIALSVLGLTCIAPAGGGAAAGGGGAGIPFLRGGRSHVRRHLLLAGRRGICGGEAAGGGPGAGLFRRAGGQLHLRSCHHHGHSPWPWGSLRRRMCVIWRWGCCAASSGCPWRLCGRLAGGAGDYGDPAQSGAGAHHRGGGHLRPGAVPAADHRCVPDHGQGAADHDHDRPGRRGGGEADGAWPWWRICSPSPRASSPWGASA